MTFEMRETAHAQPLSRKIAECLEHVVLGEEMFGMIGEVGRRQVTEDLVLMLKSLDLAHWHDMETPFHTLSLA